MVEAIETPTVKEIPRTMDINGRQYMRQPSRCSATGRPIVQFAEVRIHQSTVIKDRDGQAYHQGSQAYGNGEPVEKGASMTPWTSPQFHRDRLFDLHLMQARHYVRTRRPSRDRSVQAEIDKFKAEGRDHLAALLEKEHPEVPMPTFVDTLVPLGETFITYSLSERLKCFAEELATLIVRHSEGDHGLLGQFKDYPEPTEAEIWSEGWLASVPVQNAVAIRTGNGFVRSVYRIFRSVEDRAPVGREAGVDTFRRNKEDEVKIITVLSPDLPPRTFCYCNKDNVAVI